MHLHVGHSQLNAHHHISPSDGSTHRNPLVHFAGIIHLTQNPSIQTSNYIYHFDYSVIDLLQVYTTIHQLNGKATRLL